MKRTPAQAGRFAAWLKRKREERYARQVDALADMRRLAGIAISASEFAQWESGSRIPREDNPKRLRLIEFFGGWTDEPVTETSGATTPPDVSAYLQRIDSLVAEMTEDRLLIRALLAELQRVRREPAGLTPEEEARLEQWAAISPGGSPPATPASPTAPARSGESA